MARFEDSEPGGFRMLAEWPCRRRRHCSGRAVEGRTGISSVSGAVPTIKVASTGGGEIFQ